MENNYLPFEFALYLTGKYECVKKDNRGKIVSDIYCHDVRDARRYSGVVLDYVQIFKESELLLMIKPTTNGK